MKKISVFYVLPLLLAAACSTEAGLQQILGSSSQAPIFLGCKAGADGSINFDFSVPVTLESAYFDQQFEFESQPQGETIRFTLEDGPSGALGGEKVTADLLVEDSKGNTLNVLVTFRTRNINVPSLVINEIRTENSNMSKENPRTEFVELFIRTAGNLGALRLYAAGNNSGKGLAEPIFEFPPVMVAAGEYVVIHTRTLASQPGCADETDGNLGASGGYEATTARDFWIPGSAARIHNTDVIFLTDQDDVILDGILLCEKDDAWKNDISTAAKTLVREDAWDGSNPADAVSTVNATPTRTVNRIAGPAGPRDTNSAADWFVKPSGTGNESPGKANING